MTGDRMVQTLELASKNPTVKNIDAAWALTGQIYTGNNYRRAMASAALLGLTKDAHYQSALSRHWIAMSEVNAWGDMLRQHPPEALHGSLLHQDAYLRLTGEWRMDRPFDLKESSQ
jgi:hypothetical protein